MEIMKFFAEVCTMTYLNTSKSSRLISRPVSTILAKIIGA
jgi:hypothetical protein